MDFFDDDAAGPATPDDNASTSASPSRRPERRRPNRRRTRIQRVVILAAILFVIVFALAWWARSCQQSRKVESYRTYFENVATAIGDSKALGKQFNAIVANPTKLSRKDLLAKLDTLASDQNEIAVRAERFEAPDTLADEQAAFATGMKVRAAGFKQLRSSMPGALKDEKGGAAKIAALAGYFSGPDAYYMDLVYLPSRTIMSEDGVTDVAVPTATYYLTWKAFDPDNLESMLERMGGSAKVTGVHGVGLVDVTATSSKGDVKLVKGQTTNNVPASSDLAFVVRVQNQGTVTEKNVAVTVTVVLPDKSTIPKEASIATIAAGKTESVTFEDFAFDTEDLSKVCTLKVKAGPVPSEQVESNNSATYAILLQLK